MSARELVRAAFREMDALPYMEGLTVGEAFALTEAGRHLMLLAEAMQSMLAYAEAPSPLSGLSVGLAEALAAEFPVLPGDAKESAMHSWRCAYYLPEPCVCAETTAEALLSHASVSATIAAWTEAHRQAEAHIIRGVLDDA